jgi:integrase
VLPTSLAATVPTLHQIPLACPGISRPPVCHNRKGKHRPLLQYTILSFGEDCDYVFVNLWGEPVGHPMSYASVDRLVRRLRTRAGIIFSVHMFRHSYATALLRRGVRPEIAARLLGHSSISVTTDTYGHLGVEDARRALVAAGVLAEPEVLV